MGLKFLFLSLNILNTPIERKTRRNIAALVLIKNPTQTIAPDFNESELEFVLRNFKK